jgi:hypothetical protein
VPHRHEPFRSAGSNSLGAFRLGLAVRTPGKYPQPSDGVRADKARPGSSMHRFRDRRQQSFVRAVRYVMSGLTPPRAVPCKPTSVVNKPADVIYSTAARIIKPRTAQALTYVSASSGCVAHDVAPLRGSRQLSVMRTHIALPPFSDFRPEGSVRCKCGGISSKPDSSIDAFARTPGDPANPCCAGLARRWLRRQGGPEPRGRSGSDEAAKTGDRSADVLGQ